MTQPSLAQNSCEEQLADKENQVAACEHVLDLAGKAIDEQKLTIELLDRQKARLEKELAYNMVELAKEKAWYRDTKIMTPAALILGIVLGARAAK